MTIKENAKYALVVEDNTTDFLHFCKMLTELGYIVLQNKDFLPVSTYEEAINLIKNNNKKIDVILIDYELAGDKKGVDIARYILVNQYPIKILFTTRHLNEAVAKDLATVGVQYGTIPKPDGSINNALTLFLLQKAINPPNPLLPFAIQNIIIPAIEINPLKNIREQLLLSTYRYSPKRIIKNEIIYIHTGKNEFYKLDPNLCIIFTTTLKKAFLCNTSLTKLIKEYLDDSFVQINGNTCINTAHYDGEPSAKGQFGAMVQGNIFQVTEKFKKNYYSILGKRNLKR